MSQMSVSEAVGAGFTTLRPATDPVVSRRSGRRKKSPDMPGFLCVCQAAGLGVVELRSAGPGSDLSEELVVGVEPGALDVRVAPECPPGPAAKRRSSASMSRQTRLASRRFKQRMASLWDLPATIFVS